MDSNPYRNFFPEIKFRNTKISCYKFEIFITDKSTFNENQVENNLVKLKLGEYQHPNSAKCFIGQKKKNT